MKLQKRSDWISVQDGNTGDFAGGPAVKNLLSNAGDAGWVAGWDPTWHGTTKPVHPNY